MVKYMEWPIAETILHDSVYVCVCVRAFEVVCGAEGTTGEQGEPGAGGVKGVFGLRGSMGVCWRKVKVPLGVKWR